MALWGSALAECQRNNQAHVLVTILTVRGSAPRPAGSKMLVTQTSAVDSIGGGQLEYHALQRARELLQQPHDQQCLEDFILGADLGQCCGGQVALLFESFVTLLPLVLVFGAGHVGRALVPILAQLPLQIRWIDSRMAEFPNSIPEGVEKRVTADVAEQVASAPVGSYYIILTHNHDLDFTLLSAALGRGDARYIGVIGSETKARRFRQRLQQARNIDLNIAHWRCPMGLPELSGKLPMEVAVAIAAEIMLAYQNHTLDSSAAVV